MYAGMAAGAVSLKKPHHIITLQFSEIVKGHAKYPHQKGITVLADSNSLIRSLLAPYL